MPTRFYYLIIPISLYAILHYFGFVCLETYEDYLAKLSFSDFYHDTNYYKVHFSFWPDVFIAVHRLYPAIPWYEIFLATLNVIATAILLADLRKTTFNVLIFATAILAPQLIFLNFTRTVIFLSIACILRLLKSDDKIDAVVCLAGIFICASIRPEAAFFAISVVLLLFGQLRNYHKVILPSVIIIAVMIGVMMHNYDESRRAFQQTEPYIFSMNDANIERDVQNIDEKSLLIKRMVKRWIIPERTFINAASLNKITYSTFWRHESFDRFIKNLKSKVFRYHQRSLWLTLAGYSFVILFMLMVAFFSINKFSSSQIKRLIITVMFIFSIVFFIKPELRIIHPTLFVFLLYVIDQKVIKNVSSKVMILSVSISILILSLIYSKSVSQKLMYPKSVYNEISESIKSYGGTNNLVWDSQAIMFKFSTVFTPYVKPVQNYILEDPYNDVTSQMRDDCSSYLCFFKTFVGTKPLVVDKERFDYILQYLKVFYNYSFEYDVLYTYNYSRDKKINLVTENISCPEQPSIQVVFLRNAFQLNK